VAERQADVVEPFHQPPAGMFVDLERSPDPRRALRAVRALRPSCARRAARTARARRPAAPARTSRRPRSTVTSVPGSASTASCRALTMASGRITGSKPALVALVRKISPNRGAITARKP